MNLTGVQEDALVELINIGFGRAGAALSKLTGHRVQLEVPQVTMCPIDEMADRLRPMLGHELATVHQIFSGPVDGDAGRMTKRLYASASSTLTGVIR